MAICKICSKIISHDNCWHAENRGFASLPCEKRINICVKCLESIYECNVGLFDIWKYRFPVRKEKKGLFS